MSLACRDRAASACAHPSRTERAPSAASATSSSAAVRRALPHPLRRLVDADEHSAAAAVLVRQAAAARGEVGLLGAPITVDAEQLVFHHHRAPVLQRLVHWRPKAWREVGARGAERLADRGRWLGVVRESGERVVVEQQQVPSPADGHRLGRCEHESERGAQARRPALGRAERRRAPHACAETVPGCRHRTDRCWSSNDDRAPMVSSVCIAASVAGLCGTAREWMAPKSSSSLNGLMRWGTAPPRRISSSVWAVVARRDEHAGSGVPASTSAVTSAAPFMPGRLTSATRQSTVATGL
jgi:hypothetical protein